MVWLAFMALFIGALIYALVVSTEEAIHTTPYRKELHAHAGNFDE